jgi:O-methyltransferase involved in polyketide biosynthesis
MTDTGKVSISGSISARWYDVDLPEAVELRRRLYAERNERNTIPLEDSRRLSDYKT